MPLPLTIAASNFDVVIYVLAGIVWIVFQIVSHAAKDRTAGPTPPAGARQQRPVPRPVDQDLKELMAMLSGRQTEEPVTEEPTRAVPVTEDQPRPRPLRPPPVRPPPRLPLTPRPSVYTVNTAVRPATDQGFKPRAMRVSGIPAPLRRPPSGAGRREVENAPARVEPAPVPPVSAVPVLEPVWHPPAANMRAQLHVTPLMHMRWPRSAFSQLIGSTSRPSRQSPLRQRLHGRQAFRQAMINRLVLGPPGGR